ncbi:MAG TPA: hypothetical protein VMM56_17840 [Planctomycetaceae bacterium]|nr:hypothetical protein [Planctomycetaceae bacterium]
MHRFSAIASLAVGASVAWFSAGQSFETRTGGSKDLPSVSEPIPTQQTTSEYVLLFETAELPAGAGTLSLAPGSELYLIVGSSDPDVSTARVTLNREPFGIVITHRWRENSFPVRFGSASDTVLTSVPEYAALELTDDRRELVASAKGRIFFLHVTDGPLDDPRQYAAVRTRVINESEHVRILLDEQEPHSERTAALARRIRNELEQTILPVCTQTFGIWRDVDGDGKLTIVLTPWLDKLQGGKTSLKGFVRGTDFDERIPAPLGNSCDAIYLNSNLSPTVNLRSLLGHEYFHVLQCSVRGNQPGRPPLEEDWLSEAQAHLAEMWLRGDDSNLRHRIDSFLTSPGTAPLVVKDYYRAGLWRDDGCRGATFLFLSWCAEREGADFLARLLRSPQTGTRGLETIMGTPFPDLHRAWTISMLSEAISPEPETIGPSATDLNSRKPIPWERLEIIPLPESNDAHRISLAPSAVRFFKISAANRETCLRIAADSNIPLQVTLIGSGQLASFRSADEKARLEQIATGLEKSIESLR